MSHLSGGAATSAKGLGGAAAAWSEVMAAAGKAEESQRSGTGALG